MKDRRRIEKFLKRIDVVPNAERKRLKLEELLKARDKTQKSMSADIPPTFGRFIMNRQIWKIAAALVVAATVIGVIGILQNGGQTAYAFEQTVAAMQGKRSFHILTYWGTPTQRKDEFWAEFDENGKMIRCRQVEWWDRGDNPMVVLWENQVKYQYEPDDDKEKPGILLISSKKQHVDKDSLEEFDPETIIEEVNNDVENGEDTIVIGDSHTQDGYIVAEVSGDDGQSRRVLLVDPVTKFVVRMDTYVRYDPDDEDGDESYVEGSERYHHGIEVLEYNKTFDTNIFQPAFPADTIIVDQTLGDVGLAQEDLSNEDIAYEVVRRALEAWAANDYETAGLLFGGAPKEFFVARVSDKPVDEIVIGEPQWLPLEPNRPRYRIICSYIVEREGRLTTINISYCVTTVAGQPGRWFVTPIKL